MCTHGTINTITLPCLKGTTQPQLIEFEVNFSAYKEHIDALNNLRTASQRIPPATLKQCICPKLLHSMCILGIIEDASSSDEATEEQIQEWFDSSLRVSTKNLAERVNDSIKLNSVQYSLQSRDPASAPRVYVLNIITALDEHNASEVVRDTEQSRDLIKKTCW